MRARGHIQHCRRVTQSPGRITRGAPHWHCTSQGQTASRAGRTQTSERGVPSTAAPTTAAPGSCHPRTRDALISDKLACGWLSKACGINQHEALVRRDASTPALHPCGGCGRCLRSGLPLAKIQAACAPWHDENEICLISNGPLANLQPASSSLQPAYFLGNLERGFLATWHAKVMQPAQPA